MTARQIVHDMRVAGVVPVRRDGHWKLTGPAQQVQSFTDLVREHRAEIIALLDGEAQANAQAAYCPPERRRFSPMADCPIMSVCTACGQARCTMLTADAGGAA